MKTIAIQVFGLVQGVGFRYTTKQLADSMGVKGIVMNRSNGSVYIEAQAAPLILQKFLSQIKLSPTPSGRVDDIKVTEIYNKNYSNFSITYE